MVLSSLNGEGVGDPVGCIEVEVGSIVGSVVGYHVGNSVGSVVGAGVIAEGAFDGSVYIAPTYTNVTSNMYQWRGVLTKLGVGYGQAGSSKNVSFPWHQPWVEQVLVDEQSQSLSQECAGSLFSSLW